MKLDLAGKRRERKMTQAELAAAVGMAQRTIAAYESGERRPSVDAAKRLAGELGVSWTEFFDDGEKGTEADE